MYSYYKYTDIDKTIILYELDQEHYCLRAICSTLMCAEKTGGFNLVNYRHSSGVYHEQETEDLHRRI